MANACRLRREYLLGCLVSFVAMSLLGCASSVEKSAPPGMRRVYLSSTPYVYHPGVNSELLGGGTPTNRFDAQQARGYLHVIFNDVHAHTMHFTVSHALTGALYIKTPQMQVPGRAGSATWRPYAPWFQIAGRLSPGPYILDLIVDDQPVGAYWFTVSGD